MKNEALERGRVLFEEAGLGLPPIPKSLMDQVREQSPWVYGTRDPRRSLYDFDGFLEECLTRRTRRDIRIYERPPFAVIIRDDV